MVDGLPPENTEYREHGDGSVGTPLRVGQAPFGVVGLVPGQNEIGPRENCAS